MLIYFLAELFAQFGGITQKGLSESLSYKKKEGRAFDTAHPSFGMTPTYRRRKKSQWLGTSGAFPLNATQLTGIKIFRLKSDFRLFSNSQDHSWDQCKSEEKIILKGVGVLEYSDAKSHWNAPLLPQKSKKFWGQTPRPPW